MKKIWLLCLGIWLAFSPAARAVDMTNPYKMAAEVATATVSELRQHRDSLGDPEFARALIDNHLMPYVDITYAAYKVMGTSLKTTSKEERAEFAQAFESYMKRSLTEVLSKYANQDIIPENEQPVPADASIVPVRFTIREAGKQDLQVVLKLRLNKKTGQWKVFDLIGENISILDAKESEIAPIIKSRGIRAAIEALNSHTPGQGR